jgi:hypothetical protein
MKIYRIVFDGVTIYFPTQDLCYKEVRRLSGKSYDPVVGESLESLTWPLTKAALVDLLNGETWVRETKVFYTAAPGLRGERPEPTQAAPETTPEATQPDHAGPAPIPEATSEPGASPGRLGPESVQLIDPSVVR